MSTILLKWDSAITCCCHSFVSLIGIQRHLFDNGKIPIACARFHFHWVGQLYFHFKGRNCWTRLVAFLQANKFRSAPLGWHTSQWKLDLQLKKFNTLIVLRYLTVARYYVTTNSYQYLLWYCLWMEPLYRGAAYLCRRFWEPLRGWLVRSFSFYSILFLGDALGGLKS